MFIPEEDDEESGLAVTPDPTTGQMQATGFGANKMVDDYIRQKFGLSEKYNDAARQKILDQNKEESSGPNWRAGLAALGAGIAGQNAGAAGNSVLNAQENERADRLAQFDKGRQQEFQNVMHARDIGKMQRDDRDDAMKQQQLLREKDPESAESKMAQQLAVKMGYKGDPSTLTAERFKSFSPSMQKMYELDQRSLDRAEARDERRSLAGQASADRAAAREQSRLDRAEREQAKLDEKEFALTTPYGKANTVDDAKHLKSAYETKKSFDSKLDELISLREKKGAEVLDRESVSRAQQLSKELLLEYKDLKKLGVLSKSDESIINKVIPDDPLEWRAASLLGQDPILTNMNAFKKDLQNDFDASLQTRLRKGAPKGPGQKVKVSNGTETLEIDPNDEADALKDGYKRIQ